MIQSLILHTTKHLSDKGNDMNIPLSLLIEVNECFEMTRHAAATGKALSVTNADRCLTACVKLKVEIEELQKDLKVEVEA